MSENTRQPFSQSYYDILEISPGADEEEIRRAYDRIKKIYSGDSLATYGLYSQEELNSFLEQVEQVYRVLIDPENRREYDKTLIAEPLKRKKHLHLTISSTSNDDISDSYNVENDQTHTTSSEMEAPPNSKENKNSEKEIEKEFDLANMRRELEIPEDAVFSGEYLKELREQANVDLRLVSDYTKLSVSNLQMLEQEDWEKLPAIVYVKGFIQQYSRFLGLDEKRVISDMMKRYEENKDYSKA